jgi:hypothetical protein
MFKHAEGGMVGGLAMSGAGLGLHGPFRLELGGPNYT